MLLPYVLNLETEASSGGGTGNGAGLLLALQSLVREAGSVVVVVETTTGTRRHRKIQRKLRRLAQWSEAIAPRRTIVIQGIALPQLQPQVASGTVVITRHVAVYNKGPAAAAVSLSGFLGIDVAIPESRIENHKSSIATGELEAAFDLLEEEYLAIAHLMPPRLRARPSDTQRVRFLV